MYCADMKEVTLGKQFHLKLPEMLEDKLHLCGPTRSHVLAAQLYPLCSVDVIVLMTSDHFWNPYINSNDSHYSDVN